MRAGSSAGPVAQWRATALLALSCLPRALGTAPLDVELIAQPISNLCWAASAAMAVQAIRGATGPDGAPMAGGDPEEHLVRRYPDANCVRAVDCIAKPNRCCTFPGEPQFDKFGLAAEVSIAGLLLDVESLRCEVQKALRPVLFEHRYLVNGRFSGSSHLMVAVGVEPLPELAVELVAILDPAPVRVGDRRLMPIDVWQEGGGAVAPGEAFFGLRTRGSASGCAVGDPPFARPRAQPELALSDLLDRLERSWSDASSVWMRRFLAEGDAGPRLECRPEPTPIRILREPSPEKWRAANEAELSVDSELVRIPCRSGKVLLTAVLERRGEGRFRLFSFGDRQLSLSEARAREAWPPQEGAIVYELIVPDGPLHLLVRSMPGAPPTFQLLVPDLELRPLDSLRDVALDGVRLETMLGVSRAMGEW